MGMFGSFIGQNSGYTAAQSAGLRRSNEIKKRREEDKRAFEREKMKFGAEEKAKERDAVFEQTMLQKGKGGRPKPQPESQYKLQQLRGSQQAALLKQKAFEKARSESMAHARNLTLGDIEHERNKEIAKIKSKSEISSLFSDNESPGGIARRGLEGNQKEHTFAQFTGMNSDEQRKYMTHMKKNDPKRYLDFARQYKLLASPKKETITPNYRDMDQSMDQSIYRSDSGIYRNY